jgi:hypothetical protein
MATARAVISGVEFSIRGGQILYKFSVIFGWPKIGLTEGRRKEDASGEERGFGMGFRYSDWELS